MNPQEKIKSPAVVLVLEGVEEVRDLIERLLITDGYSVDTARNEEAAVMVTRSRKPDLLLISFGSHGDEVVTTAQRVRQRSHLTEDVAVVIFGSLTVPEGAEVKLAGNIYLTRPDNFDQLRRLLCRLVTGRHSADKPIA